MLYEDRRHTQRRRDATRTAGCCCLAVEVTRAPDSSPHPRLAASGRCHGVRGHYQAGQWWGELQGTPLLGERPIQGERVGEGGEGRVRGVEGTKGAVGTRTRGRSNRGANRPSSSSFQTAFERTLAGMVPLCVTAWGAPGHPWDAARSLHQRLLSLASERGVELGEVG